MDILSIILIGVGLAMDCFAVSTTQGLKQQDWHMMAVLMAVLFGLFQGGMPLIGYLAGSIFSHFFSLYAPWIALALLAYIGGKMVWEGWCEKDSEEDLAEAKADWSIKRLLMLSVATSIDALATGVIFIPCPEQVWVGVGIIALCSILFSLIGYLVGAIVGSSFKLNVEVLGGLILIGIGLKIFVEGVFMA